VELWFESGDIDTLAARLASALGIPLKPLLTLDVRAYSDLSIEELRRAGPTMRLWLRLNDPEPGRLAPEVPGAGGCILTVHDVPELVARVEAGLRAAGLAVRVLP
jgi:hypothetical protein